ncbi:MAG: hypothetical protein C4318_08570, partial [Acidimicrobiia bacterium]
SEGSLRLAAQLAQIWIETAGVFDIDEESKRIRAQLAKVEAEIERASRKLEDSQFVSKAPVEVVEKERAKLEAFFQERASLEEALADLGQHR